MDIILDGYNPSENSLTCRSVDFLFFDSYCSGHLKFWKKKALGIEFAKHFRSHLGPIEGLAVSTLHLRSSVCACMHALTFEFLLACLGPSFCIMFMLNKHECFFCGMKCSFMKSTFHTVLCVHTFFPVYLRFVDFYLFIPLCSVFHGNHKRFQLAYSL